MDKQELTAIAKWRDEQVAANRLTLDRACGLILAPRGENNQLEPYLSALQSCHSSINRDIKNTDKLVETAFEVNMDSAAAREFLHGRYTKTYYIWIMWLRYLFHYSPFIQVFSTGRDLTYLECMLTNLIPIDLGKAPANVTMAAMTCIRHLWESGINEWPKRFNDLHNIAFFNYINPDLAFLLAPYIELNTDTGVVKFAPIKGNTNHMLFCPGQIGLDYVQHFCDHEWINFADGTITNGVDYLDGTSQHSHNGNPRWNVYSLFQDKVITPSDAMSARGGEWYTLLKGLFPKDGNGLDCGHFVALLQYALPQINVEVQ